MGSIFYLNPLSSSGTYGIRSSYPFTINAATGTYHIEPSNSEILDATYFNSSTANSSSSHATYMIKCDQSLSEARLRLTSGTDHYIGLKNGSL